MSDISAFVRTTRNTDRNDINKLLGLITPIAFAKPEQGGVNERIILDKKGKKRTLTMTTGALDVSATNIRNKGGISQNHVERFPPTSCISYPLIHTITGTPVNEKILFSKFGAGGINNATKYITTTHNSMMDMGSGSFAFAVWYKSTSSATNHGILCKKDTTAATNAGVDFYVSSTGHIVCSIGDGTNSATLDKIPGASIKDGLWHSIIINIPSAANLEAFLDGSSLGTQSHGSVGNINNSLDAYEGARYNGSPVNQLNGSIAFFFWKTGTFSAQQITDWTNGQFATANDIIIRPYVGDWSEEPSSTTGICQSV